MNDTVVFYNGEQVSVPKEVAEFLEKDRKRAQAQARQDKRHLSRSEFETVLSSHMSAGRPLEQSVLWNLSLENLRKAVAELSAQEQELLSLRCDGELSMEEIGKVFGISKMAVSKRLKKLYAKLRSPVI
ncbi:sigma-70 family RNA polymerase sigma factor [uncultured Oscillibacter sp.]|uniref:sigma-70 family RNA polymerase sigma factor n=1 Tax=uncultured Oscillibacter sp. TaxID=876091 RepID=UPI002615F0CB|nr:sigma-70 family RNA polymerase sigma factor [uncultured Oscillibacter sp.]